MQPHAIPRLMQHARKACLDERLLIAAKNPSAALAGLIGFTMIGDIWIRYARETYFREMTPENLDEFLFDTMPLVNPRALDAYETRFQATPTEAFVPAARIDLDLLNSAVATISRAERAYQLRHRRTPGPFAAFVHDPAYAERIESAIETLNKGIFTLPSGAGIPQALCEEVAAVRDRIAANLRSLSADKTPEQTELIPALTALRIDLLLLDMEMNQIAGPAWFDSVIADNAAIHRRLHRRRSRNNIDLAAWRAEQLAGDPVQNALTHFSEIHAAARGYLRAKGL